MTDPAVVRRRLQQCRLLLNRLSRSESLTNSDIDLAYRDVTECASELLDVARASIWRVDPLNQQIACVDLHLRHESRHERGARLEMDAAPAYFRALSEEGCVVVCDALDDPRAAELVQGYLQPRSIGALLNASISVGGRVVGAVCHEHVGPRREWTLAEELLASTMADFVGRVVEVAERRAVERTAAAYAELSQLQTEQASQVRDQVAQEVEEWRRARLQGSDEEIRRLYDASPVPLVLTRLGDGVVRYVNQRAGELFNIAPEEMVGRRAPDFYVDPDDRDNFVRELQERGRVDGFVVQLKSSTGRRVWAVMSAQQLEYSSEPCFMVGFSDVTAQKVAEEAVRHSEAGIRALLATAPAPLILSRVADNTVVLANAKAAELFEVPFEEAIGQPTPDFYVDLEDRTTVVATLRRQGAIDNFPLKMKTTSGRCLWAEMSGRVIEYQNETCFLVGVHDVTERQEASRELQRAKEAAEAANRSKSIFLARMSHELRTPLNAILGFTSIISRASNLDAEQKQQLAIVQRSGKHLLDLINGVLEMSKIESGSVELNLRSFDLPGFLKGLEDTFSLRAAQKGLQLRFVYRGDLPRRIRTDETKVRQGVINLLENAIKFTDQGSVEVTAEAGPVGTGCLRISVRDTGVGVAVEDRDRVFKPFVQAQWGSAVVKGTGLGLPITREFARLLGGDLVLEQAPAGARGSCFVFEVPVELADEEAAEPAAALRQVVGVAPGQPRRRILIVDDDEPSRMLLRALLTEVGAEVFDIREVTNGEEAVRSVQEWSPHMVWMDMRMPVMSGYEATRAIRRWCEEQQQEGALRPVIVALTASSFHEERDKIMAAGCDGFQRKPFDAAEIFELMSTHLGLRFEYQEVARLAPGPAEQPAATPADPLGLDTAAALKRLRGNRFLLRKLWTVFCGARARTAEEIDAALRAGDRDTAQRLAHTLKGAAGSVGAVDVARQAAELEQMIEGGEGEIEAPLAALQRALEQAIAAIEDLLGAAGQT